MSSRVLMGVQSVGKIMAPSCLILLAHIVRVFAFPLAYDWDQLMHFLGGASIAWIAWSSIVNLQRTSRLPSLPSWFHGLISVSFAGFIGLLWELHEYALFIWWIPSMDIRLPDTEQDMFLDVCGAILLVVGFLLHKRFFQKRGLVEASIPVLARNK